MEALIAYLQGLDPVLLYIVVFSVSFLENVFPPFPSDVVIVFLGSLVGLGKLNFILTFGFATVGGTLGFMLMYYVGHWFGDKIVERRKIRFLPLDKLHVAENWFQKYGYVLIVANRFLSGTRAVVSFFAGMSHLSLSRTIILSFVSSLIWNAILVYGGSQMGERWMDIQTLVDRYSTLFSIIVVIIVVATMIRYFRRMQRADGTSR